MLGAGSYPRFSEAQTKSPADQLQTGTIQISMERMGGYAGIHEKFSIYQDGRITNAAGQAQQLPAQALENIRRRVEMLDVPKSPRMKVVKAATVG